MKPRIIDWHFARPELAQQYLKVLFDQGIRRLAFFGRRRIGKTEFLLHDLLPLAQASKMATLYCSLWEHKDRPHLGLVQALEQAAGTHSTSKGRARLQLALPDIAEAEIEIERSANPKAASPEELGQLTASWRAWVGRLGKKRALVVIDEVQHLATSARFATLAATLRTLLDMAPPNMKIVFTGSSYADLQRLFTNSRAPFFQFADVMNFQPMSHDFVAHLEQVFNTITGLKLPPGKLGALFEKTGRNAHILTGLTQRLVIYGTADVDTVWNEIEMGLIGPDGWCEQLWHQLSDSDQTVYLQLLTNQEPFSEASLRLYEETGFSRASAQKALLRLENRGLVSRLGHGEYLREIPMLDGWLLGAGRPAAA